MLVDAQNFINPTKAVTGGFLQRNHPDLVILQKYQSLSNKSFKHTSAHMTFLYLTSLLPFERRFRMFVING